MRAIISLLTIAIIVFISTLWAEEKFDVVAYRVKIYVAKIEVTKDGVIIKLKNRPVPMHKNSLFRNGRLFISRTDDLSKFRLEFLHEDAELKKYAFIYYNSEGEEDEDALYLKEIKDDVAVFLAKGSIAHGDGGADYYKKEFIVKRIFNNQ